MLLSDLHGGATIHYDSSDVQAQHVKVCTVWCTYSILVTTSHAPWCLHTQDYKGNGAEIYVSMEFLEVQVGHLNEFNQVGNLKVATTMYLA